MKFILIALASLCLAGCKPTSTADDPVMPERLILGRLEPVLAARFTASDLQGYQLEGFRALAVPTPSFPRPAEVTIVAKNVDGVPLTTLALQNPRTRVSSLPHEISARARATFTVFIPNLDDIRSLEVKVANGPNEGLEQVFPINPTNLPPLTVTNTIM